MNMMIIYMYNDEAKDLHHHPTMTIIIIQHQHYHQNRTNRPPSSLHSFLHLTTANACLASLTIGLQRDDNKLTSRSMASGSGKGRRKKGLGAEGYKSDDGSLGANLERIGINLDGVMKLLTRHGLCIMDRMVIIAITLLKCINFIIIFPSPHTDLMISKG